MSLLKTKEGSTGRLLELCAAYFAFYVATGIGVKYFTGPAERGMPGMGGVEYLIYSTVGANAVCIAVVLARRWYHLRSNGLYQLGPLSFPREYLYIIPSGICTAVVIPTTTLMYTLPISVMVAMVMMRGSVIVISRAVDAIQIRQGILKKRVYWEEDVAVLFALAAVGVDLFGVGRGGFDFVHSPAACVILASYITSYAIRIYLMNYYKNTRAPGVALHNEGFFAIEQITASLVMIGVTAGLYFSAVRAPQIGELRSALSFGQRGAGWAALSGTAYGMVAFFSVFIFMFKGRTATFAGLVNRLTSLVAGTTATLVGCAVFGGELPRVKDWASLGFILAAVGFLSMAERKRVGEASHAVAEAGAAAVR